MRERAAREAEAAGMTNANSAGSVQMQDVGLILESVGVGENMSAEEILAGVPADEGIAGGPELEHGSGPSTLAELELKKGKKRKSEGPSDGEKKPRIEDEDGTGSGSAGLV